jgi:hypothetical protein
VTAKERPLSFRAFQCLAWAREHGAVFAGSNVHKGRLVRFPASTLVALHRRGLVTLRTGPDGGIMARPAKAVQS